MKKFNRSFIGFILFFLALTLFLPGLSLNPKNPQAQEAEPQQLTFFPFFSFYAERPAASSYYLPTIDGDFLYELGCEQGLKDLRAEGTQDNVAILYFSYPVYESAFGYGAALYEDDPINHPTTPASVPAIKQAVKFFAQGYYNCTGSDTHSNLVIGVGTNNKGTSISTEDRISGHGRVWGAMVADLNQWALDQRILHQVQFYGASNIESWNTPSWTRTWIAGYEENEDVFLLNFGDAAGCPYEDNPQWTCSSGWSQEDVWYVSWGAPSALPLPLIYLTNGIHAKQWAYLSQYSVENHGYRMDFTGVFTSWQYCQQFPQWCDGIDNTPEEAYQQMMEELDKTAGTSQSLRWKTDIYWVRESEISGSRSGQAEKQNNSYEHPVIAEIRKLEAASQSAGLSDTLRTSLQRKYEIYQNLAEGINISQQEPALKD